MRYLSTVAAAMLAAASIASGQATQPATKPVRPPAVRPPAFVPPKAVEGYDAKVFPANIAPTSSTPSKDPVKTFGEPRMAQGHPSTLWDQQDIAHYKELLKTNKVMQEEFAKLQTKMDARIIQPLNIAEPQKDADGNWIFPGDLEPFKSNKALRLYRTNENNVSDIASLGTLYALTGDAKYGDFAKKMLLAFAHGYPYWGHPLFKDAPWTEKAYRSAFDGRLTGQFLEDGFWLIEAAFGYDLIYNLPGWTDDERKAVRDDLFAGVTNEFVADVIGPESYLDQSHNRSVICNAGVLMAGYATEDQRMIDLGLYGKGGTKEKPHGGVFGIHFSQKCISPDGMWNEGAMGYQNMASVALVDDAETLWHHGVDMYKYDNGILKQLFNAEIMFTYPDLTFPSTHDSGRSSIIPEETWNDDGPRAYEYAYLHYRDPRFLAPVTRKHLSLQMSVHYGPPSVLFDADLDAKAPITNSEGVNFTDVGYGILRLDAPKSPISLLMQYGLSRSHGHPDKLSIDLYALGDVIIPDPGVIFPYGADLDVKWYWTTPGHATLTVDESPQIYAGNRYKFSKQLPDPDAKQLVFGPASTMGIERGSSDTTYPGVMQDRALFVTPNYVADLFGAFSMESHKYDLTWHLRGKLSTDLPLEAYSFPEPVPAGYNALALSDNVRHATVKDAWQVSVVHKDQPVKLLAAAGDSTEVVIGDGYYHYSGDDKNVRDEKVPAIFERRQGSNTLFGNVVDISAKRTGTSNPSRRNAGSILVTAC